MNLQTKYECLGLGFNYIYLPWCVHATHLCLFEVFFCILVYLEVKIQRNYLIKKYKDLVSIELKLEINMYYSDVLRAR
jgi:hypothetical protein